MFSACTHDEHRVLGMCQSHNWPSEPFLEYSASDKQFLAETCLPYRVQVLFQSIIKMLSFCTRDLILSDGDQWIRRPQDSYWESFGWKSSSRIWKADFAGGQWQSISLARTLCRTRKASVEVLIIYEPSSALDPIAELHLFQRLRKEREERITIFISHRLQTTRASDCILVIDEGKLVESVTHEELLGREHGLYQLMYTAQTSNLV